MRVAGARGNLYPKPVRIVRQEVTRKTKRNAANMAAARKNVAQLIAFTRGPTSSQRATTGLSIQTKIAQVIASPRMRRSHGAAAFQTAAARSRWRWWMRTISLVSGLCQANVPSGRRKRLRIRGGSRSTPRWRSHGRNRAAELGQHANQQVSQAQEELEDPPHEDDQAEVQSDPVRAGHGEAGE